ncbi:T9SS type A sorting domain-containing protein [Runella sp.]|uniref:T9SS type A sorting domain-containing protein n=1 Tax=Runella sp. TaxID=1960881 RepID=UPI00261A5F3F|nr:T9SS type A sorting domain-containing protein [Runella sp.]
MQKVAKGIIFTANDGVNGRELWFSDGTETGTTMIKDLTVDNGGTSFSKFFKSETDENVIYFTINANELWKTDGTSQGTVLVMKASTGFALQDRYATSTTYFEQSGGSLYFLINSSTGYGYDIWRSNGSPDGNIKLGTISNSESAPYFRIAGNNLFYAGSDTKTGIELWKFPLCSHTAKISTPNGTSFCPGSSVSITGEGNGTTSPFTYKWKQGTTDAGTAATLAVTKAGTYTIEVTDKEGCTVSASVDITQTTNLPVNITGTNSFCAGQNTTLTANATGGVSPYTYQWKQNSTNVGINTNTYAATAAGSYSVGVTDSKGCTGTSAAYSVMQKPSPNVTVSTSRTPTLLTGESVVLSVPTASGQTYQWAKDGAAISGATNNSYTVSGAGSYTVTVTGGGCTATSSAVMVSIILANEPLAEEVGLRVSPNPTINQAKIVLQLAQSASANVYVLDASGRRVRTWESAGKATRHEATMDMRSVAAGSYLVQAEAEGRVFTEKLVKQ